MIMKKISSLTIFDFVEIGSIVDFNNIKLEVVKSTNECSNCYFHFCKGHCNQIICSKNERKDNTNIIFKRI